MDKLLCPDCGARISSKARVCPRCGYTGNNPAIPICEQDSYEIVPFIQYEIEEWNPGKEGLSPLRFEDNRALVEFLSDWEKVEVTLPSIAQAIREMAQTEHVLTAKMTPYIRKLIKEGKLKLQLDKQGETMAVLRSTEKNKWAKQLRLEEAELSPNLTQSLNHLTDMAMMTQILNEIENVGESVRRLHVELQEDRIAMAEGAWEKLVQARRIQDAELRRIATLGAVQSATDAKRILMRGFERSLKFIEENSGKSELKLLIETGKTQDMNSMAEDAFQDLVAMTNVVRAECEGYTMLGEYEPAAKSLESFGDFIQRNRLDDQDTLLLLNGALKKKQDLTVDEFARVVRGIEEFRASRWIGQGKPKRLDGKTGAEEGNANDEQ